MVLGVVLAVVIFQGFACGAESGATSRNVIRRTDSSPSALPSTSGQETLSAGGIPVTIGIDLDGYLGAEVITLTSGPPESASPTQTLSTMTLSSTLSSTSTNMVTYYEPGSSPPANMSSSTNVTQLVPTTEWGSTAPLSQATIGPFISASNSTFQKPPISSLTPANYTGLGYRSAPADSVFILSLMMGTLSLLS